jgi:colanic acid biosynthesis glycosyl transferase WcaI
MRILYLSQYFPPEVGATQIRAYEMARGLVRAGHHVTMIAEFPNHPSGVIPPAYKGKLYQRADLDGIEVLRVWVKASPVKTFRTRMAFYVSFMLNAALAGLFLARGRYDVVYASSPPLFVGATGLVLSFLRRAPLVFEVRDLWPESAVVLGELKNARAVRLATWLEETCYRRARRVTVTSQEILERLVQRGLPTHKLALVRNGANVDLFRRDAEARQRVRADLGLQDRFVVLYAGLFGLAYELDLVLEVARDLEQDAPDIHLLLVGEGPTREQVQAYAATLGLGHVTFLPAQPRERVPDYFNAADVSLVPIKEPNIFGMLPVKIYDSMACQVPIIVGATGEARHVVQESASGLAVDPGDGAQLRQAILSLRADPALRRRYGENGRQAVVARYSRQAQARQLEKLLRTIS